MFASRLANMLAGMSQDEIDMANQLRDRLASRLAAIQVAETALDGKVTVTYNGQGSPEKVEISEAAIAEGGEKIGKAVVDAMGKAKASAMKQTASSMQEIQKEFFEEMTKAGR